MRTLNTTAAIVLALSMTFATSFAYAQTRATSSSRASSSQQTTRSTGSSSTSRATTSSSTATRQSGTTTRATTSSSQSGTTTRATGSSTQGGTTTRAAGSTTTTRATQSGTAVRATDGTVRQGVNVSRGGLTGTQNAAAAERQPVTETYRDRGGNYRYSDSEFRLDDGHNLHRVPPRERNFLSYDRPGHFFGDHPHYYGYRVQVLPPRYRRISHWGIDYYFYDGIYYRPWRGVYVVCRPPFGTRLERAIDAAIFRAVTFSYYCDAYRVFSTRFDNYNTILEQNRIIAQNNAIIAAQNANYALNSSRALTAYELANKLGLVQSYAYANSNYYYQDGVFYINQGGQYTTIIPPAGALVTSLPDDYETIVLNGVEYYMVDNTVYRTMLFNSQPYLEVLGQMYGNLYNQYSIYR